MELIGQDLTCERGERTVFTGVSFSAAAGAMLVLRGRNGAGKTSLLRLIAGFIEPAAGTLQLKGGHGDLSIGQHCHLVAHHNAIKPSLTVRENLDFWSRFLGGGDVDGALQAFNLAELDGLSGALLSAGQQRRLALSRLALIKRPVWLLDEPTVGLDQASTGRLQTLMNAHLADNGLILASTHIDLGMGKVTTLDFDTLEAPA